MNRKFSIFDALRFSTLWIRTSRSIPYGPAPSGARWKIGGLFFTENLLHVIYWRNKKGRGLSVSSPPPPPSGLFPTPSPPADYSPPPPPADYPPPQSKLWLLLPVYMYLFTEYVFRESVDSAHNSQISSTFQEADCLLKRVKINKQVFAITLLGRNLNHTAQLSISARGEIIILSVGLGGKNVDLCRQKRPKSKISTFAENWIPFFETSYRAHLFVKKLLLECTNRN